MNRRDLAAFERLTVGMNRPPQAILDTDSRICYSGLTTDMTPEILLKAYVQYESEDAFRELVAGTLDEVYATSLRIVPAAPHLASEIAVRVYWELARKAPRLAKDVVLSSWFRERTCKMAVTVL